MRTYRGPLAFAALLVVALGPQASLIAQDDFDDFAPVAPRPTPSPALPPPLPPPSSPTPSPALPPPLPPPSSPTPSPSLPPPLPPPSSPVPTPALPSLPPPLPPPSSPVPSAPQPPASTPTPAAPARESEFDDEFDVPAPTSNPPATATTTSLPAPAATDAESAETTSAPASTDADATSDDDDRAAIANRRGMRHANSYFGPTGGIHVIDAGSGPVGTFRLSLMSDFMYLGDFLEEGDYAKRIGGALAFSWTPHRLFEVFASYQSTATWNTLGDPELIQSLGDVQLGLKVFHALRPWFVLGGDVSLRFSNPVGDVGVAFRGTSFGLRGNLTFDLRELPTRSLPFVARFNAQYWFDNTHNLVRGVENARYDGLEMPRPRSEEPRNLVTDIERFALGINRTDFVNLRFGFEAPIEVGERVQIDPLLEWNWAIPVNRTGFVCPFLTTDDDGCLDRTGAKGFPMTLTMGARVHPVVRGLSLTAAVDVGLTGARHLTRELAATMPYSVVLGASYAYDPALRADRTERVTERVVELEPVYPVRGHVVGTVVEAGTNTTVSGAIVRFGGRDANPILTDSVGGFRSYVFEPGDVAMAIEHPDYQDGSCVATIPSELPAAPAPETQVAVPETEAAPASASADASRPGPHTPEEADVAVEVRCELTARPRRGAVTLRVVGDSGPLPASVSIAISGADSRTVTTGEGGSIRVDELPAGHYVARVEQEGFFVREQEFDVAPRGDESLEIGLIARPRRALVRIAGRRIQISRQVNFVTDSDQILPTSDPLLYEVLDALQSHPEIASVEIEGHTDDRGGAEHNLELSQRRAEAVRTWLVSHGITAARLTARGYGQTRPIVPNITPGNRARNRRVQFTIRESGAAEPAAD